MATILYPDGSQREVTPENGTNFILKELQSIVQGWIELIQCRDGRLMVINENGRLEGLPYNEQATALINWPSENEIGELKAEMRIRLSSRAILPVRPTSLERCWSVMTIKYAKAGKQG